MPKEKSPTETPRSYGLGKKPKNLRFTPETIRKLKIAAQKEGVSETVYVEKALRAQFRKDGIKETE
jgi:predicted HicB family RNase H-like nuclease